MNSTLTEEPIINLTIKPNAKNIKCYSENSCTYWYKSIDKTYYQKFYHSKKGNVICDLCGSHVVNQLDKHKKTKKCALLATVIKGKMDDLQNEAILV